MVLESARHSVLSGESPVIGDQGLEAQNQVRRAPTPRSEKAEGRRVPQKAVVLPAHVASPSHLPVSFPFLF